MMMDKTQEVLELVREQIALGMHHRDRSVMVSITEYGITVSVSPWPEEDGDAEAQ